MCKIIVIVGPTASGKSELAMSLARNLGNAEIVNADAFCLYKRMDIGTAKPSRDDRLEIQHHQIDVLEPSDNASVAAYQKYARQDIDKVFERGNTAIVVGGSGLYIRALLDDVRFPPSNEKVRHELEIEAEAVGVDKMHEKLAHLDWVAAKGIGKQNIRRIIRALEVIEITGEKFSAIMPRENYFTKDTLQIGIDMPLEVLDVKIDTRTDKMRANGLTREVFGLKDELSITAAKAVGYRELLDHFDGKSTEGEAYENIKLHTRQLVRKQMSWFRRDSRIKWLSAGAHSEIIKGAKELLSVYNYCRGEM
jgi:tRNA dimethylallyltransferase